MPTLPVADAESDARFRIEYKNTKPIEVSDFTHSLQAIGNEFKRFVQTETGYYVPDQAKLYVKTIKEGSIVADLTPYAPLVLPFITDVNTVIEFAGHLRDLFNYLKTGNGEPDRAITVNELQDTKAIFEPVAKDNASQMNFAPVINGNPTFIMNFNSMEANAIQNNAQRLIRELNAPISGIRERVLFYFHQARNAPNNAGDSGVIEAVSPLPLKVIFDSDNLKGDFLAVQENIFHKAYIVDVEVQTIANEPRLYKILRLHDVIDR